MNRDLPACAGESPVEVWAKSGSPQGKGALSTKDQGGTHCQEPLNNAINPTIQSVDSRTGASHAKKKKTNREGGPLCRQVDRVLLSTTLPTRARSSLPTTSPCYQEACTSLLDNLIHQRAEKKQEELQSYNLPKTKPLIIENQN